MKPSVLIWAAFAFAQCITTASAAPTVALQPAEVRSENDIYNDKGLVVVDHYTGNLASTSRDIYFPGNGGNPIEIYRSYSGERLQQQIWGDRPGAGVVFPRFAPLDQAALGRGPWTLLAAPHRPTA